MKNIYKALAGFQQECPVIHKETQGYGYTYADLPSVFEKIKPLLKEHGLAFTQLVEGAGLKTILIHVESGETLESTSEIPQGVKLKGMNDFQVAGSAITYFRRYALGSMLGIVTDKDTGGHGEQYTPETPAADPLGWAYANINITNKAKSLKLSNQQVKEAVELGGYQEYKVIGYMNSMSNNPPKQELI